MKIAQCCLSCSQLMEIVFSLTDGCELVDWRRFLLSAALPWPFPSLTQLLDVLQHFKAADTDDTGYINEEQYLKVSFFVVRQTPPYGPACAVIRPGFEFAYCWVAEFPFGRNGV